MKKQFLTLLTIMGVLHLFAQTKLTSATIGMVEARQIGPATMSGRVSAIEGVNRDPRIFYVGAAGGGVWKTTTGGATFKPIFDKYCQSIGAIAIDQMHPDTLWVGTGESNMRNSVSIGNGLYKSTDGGENWIRVGLEKTEHIAKIIVHPKNGNIIYVAAPGTLWSDSPDRGLYKTSDGGKTWEKLLYFNEKTGCADIAMDPTNPDIIYATTWEFRRQAFSFNSGGKGSGIYKSIDGGKNWKKLTNGLPEGDFGRVALALSPSSPKHLLAIVESKDTGLFITEDGGETWKKQSATSNVCSRPFYFSCLVVDPKDDKRVYRPGFSFSISKDGGYSFYEPSYGGGGVHPDHHALWINPQNTAQLFLGTDGGVYVSNDKGNSWNFLKNLPIGQFYHVTYDNQSPYYVYGGLQDNGSWRGPSKKNGGILNGDWQGIFGGDGFWVQPDESNHNIVFAEYQGGHVSRINMISKEALDIQPQPLAGEEKLRWNWNTPIVKSPTNPKTLYMGAQYLYKTQNQGQTWLRISPDLTTNDKAKQQQEASGGLTADVTSAENHCTIFSIAESPLDENLVWAGTDDGNLQYTTDAGKNWTNVAANYALSGVPKGTWVSSIEPSHFDKNTVYVTFDNHTYGDMNTYIAKSTDMGKTWRMFKSNEFTGFAHKIKEDLVNKSLLFLGTEMGLFVSIDGGENWVRMKANIPEYSLVRDLQIHPKTNDLVIGTHGRGILIVDDISPLRSLNQDILNQDFTFLNNRPASLRPDRFGGGEWNAGEFIGSNYTEDAVIMYYLKDRVTSGDVRIEIYDNKGNFLYDMPGSKRKGINKVTWGMRLKPPKMPNTGSKLDGSGFTSPMVEPGTYTIRVIKGTERHETKLQVNDNEQSEHSLSDRQLQRKTAREVLKMVENLSYETQKLVELQGNLKKNMDNLKDVKAKKMMQEYYDKLEATRKKIVPTREGAAAFFADESEVLQSKLSELYGRICYYEGRPTDSQLERIKGLQLETNNIAKEIDTNNKTYLDKINAALSKNKLAKIELLKREEWSEKDKVKTAP